MLDGLMSTLSGQGKESNLHETLVEQDMPQEEATYYQRELESGRIIVTVQSYGHQQQAYTILYHFGADYARTDPAQVVNVHTVQLCEEVLEPHVQSVEIGEVSIRKVVVTEEKTTIVSIMREELLIERHPVSPDQPSYQRDHSDRSNHLICRIVEIGEGETIRIPARSEQILTEKRPVVTEEPLVGKREVREIQRYTDTVQREEARIEREGKVTVREGQWKLRTSTRALK
jgi:uncharacterized protein (TIGR02271 family)